MSSAERKGREEGKREEKLFIAFNLKKQHVPLEVIARSTGLFLEDIGKL